MTENCSCDKNMSIERVCMSCKTTWIGRKMSHEISSGCSLHRNIIGITGSNHLLCKTCDNEINNEVQNYLRNRHLTESGY